MNNPRAQKVKGKFLLATPVSHLLAEPDVQAAVLKYTDCFEWRDHSPPLSSGQLYLWHSDLNMVSPWERPQKEFITAMIKNKPSLRVVSFHVAASCSAPKLKNGMYYPGGQNFSESEMFRHAQDNVRWLRNFLRDGEIEIAVENNNYYPTEAYRHITDTGFMRTVVRGNGLKFLLDLAHAKITAHNQKISYEDYLKGLPLKDMIQIHVSRQAVNEKDLAYDAHLLPDEPIFHEVKEILRSYGLEYLTIEYYKEAEGLLQVLKQYQTLRWN